MRATEQRFEQFVAARLPALVRFARMLTASLRDAEDLVQEALVRTGLSWRRVCRQDDPEAYVHAVMVRLVTDRRATGGAAPVGSGETEPVPPVGAIDAALAALPALERAVLVLRCVEGLSDAQIAALLAVGPRLVAATLGAALVTLGAAAGPASRA